MRHSLSRRTSWLLALTCGLFAVTPGSAQAHSPGPILITVGAMIVEAILFSCIIRVLVLWLYFRTRPGPAIASIILPALGEYLIMVIALVAGFAMLQSHSPSTTVSKIAVILVSSGLVFTLFSWPLNWRLVGTSLKTSGVTLSKGRQAIWGLLFAVSTPICFAAACYTTFTLVADAL